MGTFDDTDPLSAALGAFYLQARLRTVMLLPAYASDLRATGCECWSQAKQSAARAHW